MKPIDWKRLGFAVGSGIVYYLAVGVGHMQTGVVSEALLIAAAAWVKVGE